VLGNLPNHANKAPVEQAILNSTLEYSFLHPTVLFQNYAEAWPRIVKTGTLMSEVRRLDAPHSAARREACRGQHR
jgi:hypothetical protein